MMRYFMVTSGVVWLLNMLVMHSCNPPWEDHYVNQEDYIDVKLWEAISQEPRYSTFVSNMEATGMDTIFQEEIVYTLFVPTNEAFESVTDTGSAMQWILPYHISQTLFMDRNVQNWRRLQTLLGKFALVEANENGRTYDGIPLEYSSPLFLDGKYYEIPQVALPKPNLYEFVARTSPVLKEYIDSKDSVYLDRNRSTPIGFDDEGNTIYDSIFGMVNLFEEEFFPVSMEFRDQAATFILFSQEQYDQALDDVAGKLGGNIVDHNDIPKEWQTNVLLPDVTKNALFEGILSYNDLEVGWIRSITGDTVVVEAEKIDPGSKFICSNGVAYLYSDFSVNDSLFHGTSLLEGENLIDSIGAGKFAWKEGVIATGAIIEPEKLVASVASGGAIVNVSFGRNYDGEYTLVFAFKDLFPMRYRLEWRANSRPSGVFKVYVNDQVLDYQDKFGNTYTEFDTDALRQSVISVTGERFLPEGGFNMRDYWVNHLTDYSDVTVRFEYVGSGVSSTNGLNIDYIKLIPDF
jgi:hypothetical protein